MMQGALVGKAFREARWLLLGCCLVLFVFQWFYVWMISQISLDDFVTIVNRVPKAILKLVPIPIEEWLTIQGRVSMSYNEPIFLVVLAAWSLGRGSDAVSGELNRGTMEMLLAQPVSRTAVLAASAGVTVFGCAAIALAAWLGTATGLAVVKLDNPPDAAVYLPCAASVFALGFFLSGATTAVSAADRYRWRTIGIVMGVSIVEKIIELASMMVQKVSWLERLTYFSLFKPPRMAAASDPFGPLFWQYNAPLLAMGAAAYVVAAITFSRRDLPAPL